MILRFFVCDGKGGQMRLAEKSGIICGVVLFISLFAVGAVLAASDVLKLRDGTIIRGKIISKDNGVYQVQTDSLGVLTFSESEVLGDETAADGPAQGFNPDEMKARLTQNPQFMSEVQNLSQDASIIQIVSDKSLLDAIAKRDYQAVANNPNFKKFTSNPAVQKLVNSAAVAVPTGTQEKDR